MQARHGGLLALKYLLAARPDAAAELLPDALPSAMVGLQVWRLIWPQRTARLQAA